MCYFLFPCEVGHLMKKGLCQEDKVLSFVTSKMSFSPDILLVFNGNIVFLTTDPFLPQFQHDSVYCKRKKKKVRWMFHGVSQVVFGADIFKSVNRISRKGGSEITKCRNLLFLVWASSHHFLKLRIFKLVLFHHLQGKESIHLYTWVHWVSYTLRFFDFVLSCNSYLLLIVNFFLSSYVTKLWAT